MTNLTFPPSLLLPAKYVPGLRVTPPDGYTSMFVTVCAASLYFVKSMRPSSRGDSSPDLKLVTMVDTLAMTYSLMFVKASVIIVSALPSIASIERASLSRDSYRANICCDTLVLPVIA